MLATRKKEGAHFERESRGSKLTSREHPDQIEAMKFRARKATPTAIALGFQLARMGLMDIVVGPFIARFYCRLTALSLDSFFDDSI